MESAWLTLLLFWKKRRYTRVSVCLCCWGRGDINSNNNLKSQCFLLCDILLFSVTKCLIGEREGKFTFGLFGKAWSWGGMVHGCGGYTSVASSHLDGSESRMKLAGLLVNLLLTYLYQTGPTASPTIPQSTTWPHHLPHSPTASRRIPQPLIWSHSIP